MTEVIPASETQLVIYTALEQRAEARNLLEAAEVLLRVGDKYEVVPSEGDVEVASEFRARLNKTITALDEERLATTEAARQVVANINAQASAVLDPLKGMLKKVDKALLDYRAQEDAKRQAVLRAQAAEVMRLAREKAEAERREQEAREAAAAAASAAERLELVRQANEATAARQQIEVQQGALSQAVAEAPQPKSIMGSRGSRTTFTDHWVWELVDIKLVPEEYLLAPVDRLDRKLLNAAAQSKKDKVSVPGIRIFNQPVPSSRVSK